MKTKYLLRAALCLALIAVGARIQIPLPYFDYYTFQFTFVLLTAVLLPPIYAIGTMVTYIAMGLLGIPVFAGGGGFDYVLRPSFGYLIGFLATVVVLAQIYKRKQPTTKWGYFLLNTIGIVVTYLFGLTYKTAILHFYLGQAVPIWAILTTAFAFDIPADVIMVFCLSLIEVRVVKAIGASNLG